MTVVSRPPAVPAAAPQAPDGPGHELAKLLAPLVRRAAARGMRTLVSATVPGPRCDPIELYAAARVVGATPAIWFQPSEGFGLVAIGSAWVTRTAGPDRFRAASNAWAGLTDGAFVSADSTGLRGTGPLLVGGFPFWSTADRADEPWAGFERGALVLPRVLLTIDRDCACLTANLVVEGDTEDLDERASEDLESTIALWDRVWDALPKVPLEPATRCLESAAVPARDAWQAAVSRLAGAVGRGRVDKVVIARRVDLEAGADLDIAATLRRLEVSAPESTIFAMARADRTFLGATPERLVRAEGRVFQTVALAGSTARGEGAAQDDRLAGALLASDKDREEHRVVVEMLRDALTPVSEQLAIDRQPHVVRLRHLQHLATEVSGHLRDQVGILALVDRLHPTPAVGGQPRQMALELIREEEHLDRGWYAGPVGWLDRRGDGEFAVALRSAMVRGRSASLFAGCGIVADSDPAREWEESRLKLRLLESALGSPEP